MDGVSNSDILTAVKNIVTGLNAYTTAYTNVNGAASAAAISSATIVKASSGRVATVIVTTAGSSTGTVYDSASLTTKTVPIYVVPNTVGVYVVNMPTTNGIFVSPGTGQVLTVSYS